MHHDKRDVCSRWQRALRPAKLCACVVQGDREPKVQQKRALLVGEGVRFSGSKVSPSSVVLAEELLALA